MPKHPQQRSSISYVVQPITHSTLGVYDSGPPPAGYMWTCGVPTQYTFGLLAVLNPVRNETLPPSFHPDVTHETINRLSPLFQTASDK